METSASTSGTLRCVIVTPEKAVLDQACDFIALPMYDGELGVMHDRAPLIGRLGYGELRLQIGKITHRYYVDGGFVQIKDNVVTVLTHKAIGAKDINVTVAEETLKAAQKPATDLAAQESQARTQQRARAQIRIARHAAEEPVGLSLHNV